MQARPATDATCGGLVELSGLTPELMDALLQAALDDVLQLDNVVAGVGLTSQISSNIYIYIWSGLSG
jgi:hypothetical protein